MLEIRKLSRERFNAFVDWTRMPDTEFFSEELEWYSDRREHVLGTVLWDLNDEDFAYIVLGRDEALRFRCIDLGHSIGQLNTARARLKKAMRKYARDGQMIFPQGDVDHKPVDLFTPVVAESKMHTQFHRFLEYAHWTPATGILKEMMRHFQDVDGNFVEQFQTTGFDSRLWELYLFAYLTEERLFIDRKFHAPDFVVQKFGKTVCIEAVTVNPTGSAKKNFTEGSLPAPKSPEEIESLLKDFMPIKFGSPLYSKLSKDPPYWELPHVQGHPLVFAIADFHDVQSMLWSSSALWRYLYGVQHEFGFDADGKLIISPLKIDKHRFGTKEIPSGFFFLPEAENVSAILFSNSGTISKFNRMGKLAGFGSSDIRLFRNGLCHDHSPNAHLPRKFYHEVAPGLVTETWAEGLSMFNNPNARHPVPKELFPTIAHHEFLDGDIVSRLPDFHPYSSITLNMKVVGGKEESIELYKGAGSNCEPEPIDT